MILQGGNDKVILMRQTNSFSVTTNGVGGFSSALLSKWKGVWKGVGGLGRLSKVKAGWGGKGEDRNAVM